MKSTFGDDNSPAISMAVMEMRLVKSIVRNRPLAYDALKRVKRRLSGQTDPTYDWFDLFSREVGRTRFIQIGASDGLRNDPIREFIIRDAWEGVLIEPLPGVFELLKRNYRRYRDRLNFMNAAISSQPGTLKLWTLDDAFARRLSIEQRLEYLRKASIDRDHIKRCLDGISEDVLTQISVPCFTLSQVAARYHPDGFDLLVIDAEGHEPEIIGSMDLRCLRPKAIFFESHNIQDRLPQLLEGLVEAGYSLSQLGGDSVAVLSGTSSFDLEHVSTTS